MHLVILQNEPYNFSHILFISRTYRLSPEEEAAMQSAAHPAKRQKVPNTDSSGPSDGIYSFHPEDEYIQKVLMFEILIPFFVEHFTSGCIPCTGLLFLFRRTAGEGFLRSRHWRTYDACPSGSFPRACSQLKRSLHSAAITGFGIFFKKLCNDTPPAHYVS